MRRTLPLFLLLLIIGQQSFAQRRNVSLLDENRMFSYTITRYSPAWEIQSGKQVGEETPVLSDQSKLFRKLDDVNVNGLKDLPYAKGFVPREVEHMSNRSMESYLAHNRLVMHYRIRYGSHTIFIAHLNNSKSRSVIPFLISDNRWILDTDFAETDFFNLIAKPHFNAYTGSFNGMAICDLAFEEMGKDKSVYDYSGRGHSAIVKEGDIVNGRIGGAVRLNPETDLTIDLRNERELLGKRFNIDFHVNVHDNIFNKERKRVIFSIRKEQQAVELFLENGFLHLSTVGARTMSVPYRDETWFHVTIEQSGKKLLNL